MSPRFRTAISALTIVAFHHTCACAQDDNTPVAVPPAKLTRIELRDKQLDVSLETRDIERVIGKLKRASDLAKTRISDAAKTSEAASAALDKGDSKNARSDARQTSEMFKEIIRQLEALLEEETPQRVAAARNMAKQLATLEKQFAENLGADGTGNSGKDKRSMPGAVGQEGTATSGGKPQKMTGTKENSNSKLQQAPGGEAQERERGDRNSPDPQEKTRNTDPASPHRDADADGGTDSKREPAKSTHQEKEKQGDSDDESKPNNQNIARADGARKDKPITEADRREALARRAEQLEKMGETLSDVLQSIVKSNDPADKEASAKLEAILSETKLLKSLEAMKGTAEMIRAGKLNDAQLGSLDLADRLTIAAERLDAAYRKIVEPQAEELRKLEERLAEIREKRETLETKAQVMAWQREVQQAVQQAERLGISSRTREDLLDQLKTLGADFNSIGSNWAVVGGLFVPPTSYERTFVALQEEVQARIQILLLGDITSEFDEATPPKYQNLVDRYYEVLSNGGAGGGKKPATQSPMQAPRRK